MRIDLHKLATWLALVAVLLSGLLSGGAFVVCVEADGSTALEFAFQGCDGCPGETSTDGTGRSEQLSGCPCVDVSLPSAEASTKRIERGELRALPPALESLGFGMCDPRPFSTHVRGEPRPAPGLALIRTVVLRV